MQVWTGGRHSSFVPLPLVQPRRRCTVNLDHRTPHLFPSPHPPAQLDGRSQSRMAPKRKTHFSNVEIEQMLAEVRRSSPWTTSLVVQPIPPFAKAAVGVVPG